MMGAFDSPPVGSCWVSIDTYGLPLTVFELFSWFQKRFPSDPDTMTNTAVKKLALLRAAKNRKTRHDVKLSLQTMKPVAELININ